LNEIEWEVDKSKTLFQNLQAVSIIFQLIQQRLSCGHIVTLIHVYGQYQCPICKIKALPCFNGNNYKTNLSLSNELMTGKS
jgi:DNA-directed RNA polymerase subunit RPC12/RpoP